MTSFFVWNLECCRKRGSRWALGLPQIHRSFVDDQSLQARKTRNSFEKIGCYFVSFFCSIREKTKLKIEDLKCHAWGYAILLLVCIFGLDQVLSACAQAAKDLAAQGHRPHKNSKFFRKLLGIPPWVWKIL